MKSNESFPELAPCHCANIRWISREVSRFYQKFIDQSGLKLTQYALLSFLKPYGPLTMNELSRISRLDRTTLVRKLKPLQSEGLACMYTSGAKTANLIALTDKGKKVLETTDPLWNRAQESFRERFDGDEWEYFTRILLKLGQINDPIK